jgi:hypothetical protein
MPTQAERAAFADEKAEKPKGPKLINPDADAVATIKANLDAVQAPEHKRHSSSPYQQITVREMTSDEWKRHTSDSWRVRNWRNVRIRSGGGWRGISVLVVITDSKRSPLPAETETEDPSNASAAG